MLVSRDSLNDDVFESVRTGSLIGGLLGPELTHVHLELAPWFSESIVLIIID